MHFRILQMIATSGFLTALECTKFVFGWGFAPDPTGELTALPRTPSWFKRALLLRVGEGTVREGKERDRGHEGEKGHGK